MKTWMSSLFVVAPLLLVAGCASTQNAAYSERPAQSHEITSQDSEYVALVESIAKQRGTQVVWVNPPKKRIAESVAAAP